jgi:hypothetical protein
MTDTVTAPGGMNGHGGKPVYCRKCGHPFMEKIGTVTGKDGHGVGCYLWWDAENPDDEHIDRFCPACGINIYNNPPIEDCTTRTLKAAIDKLPMADRERLLLAATEYLHAAEPPAAPKRGGRRGVAPLDPDIWGATLDDLADKLNDLREW